MDDAGIPDRRERFCEEYLVDLNARQAAIRAGYSARSAHNTAQRLLRNADVRARLEDLKRERQERVHLDQDRVLRELASVAFARVTDVARWDAETGITVVPSDQLGHETAAAIMSVKCRRSRTVKGKGDDAEPWVIEDIEVKMHPKVDALGLLMRHLSPPDEPGGDIFNVTNNTLVVGLPGLTDAQRWALASRILDGEEAFEG